MSSDQKTEVESLEESVLRMKEDLEREREQWERQRLQETRRLSDEAKWLAEAWRLLEAEERRVIGQQESLRASAVAREPNESRPPNDVSNLHNAGIEWTHVRQLRREIQKHARTVQ
jgi:hypothetical protein